MGGPPIFPLKTDRCFQLQIRTFLGFSFFLAEFYQPLFEFSVSEISGLVSRTSRKFEDDQTSSKNNQLQVISKYMSLGGLNFWTSPQKVNELDSFYGSRLQRGTCILKLPVNHISHVKDNWTTCPYVRVTLRFSWRFLRRPISQTHCNQCNKWPPNLFERLETQTESMRWEQLEKSKTFIEIVKGQTTMIATL